MSSRSTPQTEHAQTGREPVFYRSHSTYEQDHWRTAHVDRVDQIGAFESAPIGNRPAEQIRVDLDGFGHGGASMHDVGENIQASIFLTPDTALTLREELGEQLARADLDWPDHVDEETVEKFEETLGDWHCGNCGTEFAIDGVLAHPTDHDVACPVCDTGAEHVERPHDHPAGVVVDE